MNRRRRFVAGLVSLTALTFSIAEGVAASVCAAEVETGARHAALGTRQATMEHAGMTDQGGIADPGRAMRHPGRVSEPHGMIVTTPSGMHGHQPGGAFHAEPSPPAPHGHDCMGHEGSEGDPPHCPMSTVPFGISCAAAASLPAEVTGLAPLSEAALRLSALAARPDVLLATTPFHPPRA